MKIILNRDVPNLGEEGDVCVVKDGYARNYLIPTGAAVLYNKASVALFESRKAQIEKRKEIKRQESASLKERLDAMTISLVVSAGESGRLFGSVNSAMIQEALAKEGINIERKRIDLASHAIKEVGNHTVLVHLYEKEVSTLHLTLISEAEVKKAEAEAARAKAEEERKARIAAEKAAREARLAEQAAQAAEEAQKAEEAPAAETEPAAEPEAETETEPAAEPETEPAAEPAPETEAPAEIAPETPQEPEAPQEAPEATPEEKAPDQE